MRSNENRASVRDGASLFTSVVGMLALIVGLVVAPWRPACAEIQNDLIGFSPNHVFENAEAGEHIDVMSGNMSLTVPIGPRFKLTDDFSWGLTLYYNSKIWEHVCPTTVGALCTGTLPSHPVNQLSTYSYGLGWTMGPGRVYHNSHDYSYVYRVVLEDGSDHLFCDPDVSRTGPRPNPNDVNCPQGGYTADGSRIQMSRWLHDGINGWKAVTTDGRTIEFARTVTGTPGLRLVNRVTTTALRPDGSPRAWVDYSHCYYANGQSVSGYISDSQGRRVSFGVNNFPGHGTQTITFTGYTDPLTQARVDPVYELKLVNLPFKDPIDPGTHDPSELNHSDTIIESIWFPGLDPETSAYKFEYTMPDPDPAHTGQFVSYGWMTQRTLPTGAVIKYQYDTYRTSDKRPYHVELIGKELTLLENPTPYNWSWNRFSVVPTPAVPSSDPLHPLADATYFLGTNPHIVAARDPFNNLTLYEFNATTSNLQNGFECNGTGECSNKWSDGTLASMSTYAGPYPDSAHLVRRVDYQWDSDLGSEISCASSSASTHKMFQYRPPDGFECCQWPGCLSNYPKNINTMAVNVRQVEEKTFVPQVQGSGRTVTVDNSDWYEDDSGCPEPRRKKEYVDGVWYRTNYTDSFLDTAHNCATHHYVEVTDAAGSVVSHVDRKFTDGQLECEVRRTGAGPFPPLESCTEDGLSLQPGDVATVNTFDATATREVIQTTVSGGDTGDSRTVNLGYLQYTIPDPQDPGNTETGNTPYLMTKTYSPFTWNAVNRAVDLGTGWTQQTHDPAGNTTNYTWDALGRLTQITPCCSNSPEKPTIISYPNLKETHVRQSLSWNDFVETVYLYDSLGRLVTTRRRNATGAYDAQYTEYDIAGRMTRKSEWVPDASSPSGPHWTTYDYTLYTDPDPQSGQDGRHPDPLGRIHGVTTPDDLTPETPTTETIYDGNKTTVRVRDINGWASGSVASLTSTTVYTHDALGRLIAVDAPGGGANAQYFYDEADNLTEVQLADPAAPAHIQVRHFEYDRLGRLRAAANPENGTVEYSSYDARGNLLRYTNARQNAFTMAYDEADRLLTRAQSTSDADLPLVQNFWDSAVGVDSSGAAGRLVQQDSYKVEEGSSTLVATVQFGYGSPNSTSGCPVTSGGYMGLNGRLISQTSVVQPWAGNVSTYYCQNALGMPTLASYPDVNSSGRTRTQVLSAYVNGYLTTLDDSGRGRRYITNTNYAAGGVPTEIDRGSEKELITLDVRNRPSRIQSIGNSYSAVTPDGAVHLIPCSEVAANPADYPELAATGHCEDPGDGGGSSGGFDPYAIWDSGDYAYDMAGNVKKIGSEQYFYDPLSRLVHGSVANLGTTYALDYDYDAFGNMTSHGKSWVDPWTSGTNSFTRNYVIDWRTNRMTTQTAGASSLGYVYDESGNIIAEGVRGLVFDEQNRLREVMDRDKGRIGKYDYDASGFRVRAEADGSETFYFRDAAGQVLSEFQRPIGSSDDPVWNKDYIYAFGKSFALIKNEVPGKPKRPWATSLGDDSQLSTGLVLHWSPVNDPDILGYVIERRWKTTPDDPNEQSATTATTASQLSWTDTYSPSIAAGCLTHSVRAMDSADNVSDPGPQLRVCPQADAPPPPSNVVAIPGERSVTLRWDRMTGSNVNIQGYEVGRLFVGKNGFLDWRLLTNVLLTTEEFMETPLASGGSYSYAVRAIDTSNRASDWSGASADVTDGVPPGKVIDVFAEPDRAAGRIIVSWRPGPDSDVASFVIYRADDSPIVIGRGGSTSLGTQLAPPPEPIASVPANGQLTYGFTDTSAEQGHNYFYAVVAVDSSGNASQPSTRASARPRYFSFGAPIILSVDFGVDTKGPTSTDGLPGHVDGGEIHSEDDDVISATIRWSATSDQANGYRIYRNASDEHHFRLLPQVSPPTLSGGVYSYSDGTITKSHYTYFVAGLKWVNGVLEETAAATIQTSGADRFVRELPPDASVRNLVVTDGRNTFATDNKVSRLATVAWSRVAEPGLVGYNVYRMCSFDVCDDVLSLGHVIDAFTCAPNWVRVNSTILAPEQREFGDGSTGGLQGCFLYAVRPVDRKGVEGSITKVVVANLTNAQNPDQAEHSKAAVGITSDDLERDYIPVEVMLNHADTGINQISRGMGDSAGRPRNTFTVLRKEVEKEPESGLPSTKYHQISWTWASSDRPSDLKGFYVEASGSPSPDGPWERLTPHPVAWWENRYSVQGVALDRCGGWSSHADCRSYRVIAVDEDGNESEPVYPTGIWTSNPSLSACPRTPAPPTNLRASTVPYGAFCSTHLEWDASTTGATEYYVYRMNLSGYDIPFFYPTQRVVNPLGPNSPPPTTYTEVTDYWAWHLGEVCEDVTCPNAETPDPMGLSCPTIGLQAYYVTARNALLGGGESPRSNLVFWECGQNGSGGYSLVSPTVNPTEAIASTRDHPTIDSLACWLTDGNANRTADSVEVHSKAELTLSLASAPMTRLGELTNPPWEKYNLHTDHLGTVRAITDSHGVVVSMHNYFPFGEEMPPQQGNYNTHQYTGHERDKETGLDYMLARYYEAGLGRMLSPDPGQANAKREDPQSWNAYAYVQNNPLTFTDPTGLDVVLMNNRRTLKAALTHGMTKEEKKNIELDKKTGQLRLKDKTMAGDSPQYKYMARAIKDDNTAFVQMVKPTDKPTGPATGTTPAPAAIDLAGGGLTATGSPTGSDHGANVDIFLSSGGNPTGTVLGTDGKAKSDPSWLVAQHELCGEGLQAMEGSAPSGPVAVSRENEIRSYLGMDGPRSTSGHEK